MNKFWQSLTRLGESLGGLALAVDGVTRLVCDLVAGIRRQTALPDDGPAVIEANGEAPRLQRSRK